MTHGLVTLLGLLGETDAVLYFRDTDDPRHHAHVHAVPRAQYVPMPRDIDFNDFQSSSVVSGNASRMWTLSVTASVSFG